LQEFHIFLKVNLLIGLISFPTFYLLVQWNGLAGALEARLALTIIELLAAGYFLRVILRRSGIRISSRRAWPNMRQLLGFGFPTLVGQLASGPVQTFLTSLLAAQPHGISQLGLYTTANRLTVLAGFLPGSMASTLIPVLSGEWGRGDRQRFSEAVLLALRMFWLITLPY
jgi:O-antigen/teichoic acid export membrane protein